MFTMFMYHYLAVLTYILVVSIDWWDCPVTQPEKGVSLACSRSLPVQELAWLTKR